MPIMSPLATFFVNVIMALIEYKNRPIHAITPNKLTVAPNSEVIYIMIMYYVILSLHYVVDVKNSYMAYRRDTLQYLGPCSCVRRKACKAGRKRVENCHRA